MNYTIVINQKAIIDNNLKLDIINAAILDFLMRFAEARTIQCISFEGKIYYWFRYSTISKNMPLLGLNSGDSAYRRLKKLVKDGFLIPHPENSKLGRSYFAFTPKVLVLKNDWQPSDSHPSDTNVCSDYHPSTPGQSSDVPPDSHPDRLYNKRLYNNDSSNTPYIPQGGSGEEKEKEVFEVEQEEVNPTFPFERPSNLKEKSSAKKESAGTNRQPAKKASEELPHSQRFAHAWEDWEQHRGDIRRKITPTSARIQLEQLGAMSEEEAVNVIYYTIMKGWHGLADLSKVKNDKSWQQQKVSKPDDYQQREVNIQERRLRFRQNRQ